MPRLARPPGSPAVLAGFFNLGVRRIAAVDLSILLEIADARDRLPAEDLYRTLILLAGSESGLAFLVDSVIDVRRVQKAGWQPRDGLSPPWSQGVFPFRGHDVILLSPDALFGQQARARLQSLEAAQIAREASWTSSDA